MARDAQDDLRITDQFNFEVFWADHGKQVTAAVVTIVGVGFVLLYWQHQSSMQAEQAADSLARATDVSALERVIQDFPKSKTAAEALSQLADLYYRNAKYAEAASTYGIILRDFPTYPLAESAKLSLATVLEAQGNMNGAGAQYQQIISSSPNSYVGNAARMGLARCLEIQGQRKEARQTYEEILAMGQNLDSHPVWEKYNGLRREPSFPRWRFLYLWRLPG